MKAKLKKSWCLVRDLTIHFSRDVSTYFYKGWQAGLKRAYLGAFARSLLFYLNQFRINLHSGSVLHHHIHDNKIKKLQCTAQGLHALLPNDERFSYSILIPSNNPRPHLL